MIFFKKRYRLPNHIAYILSFSLIIGPTSIHSQNYYAKTKEKASQAASWIAGKIQGGLSNALSSIRNLKGETLVTTLQEKTEQLGQKVGYMATCIAKGSCSNSERAAFIGTSLLILALTAGVIGYTVSVASSSKEIDEQVSRTNKQISGWGPSQIFERLTNRITEFKESLTSLRSGIQSRTLTKAQKNFLYGTALSITALVVIALGIGIGSYVYSQKKEAERAADAQNTEEETQEPSSNLVDNEDQEFDDNPATEEEIRSANPWQQFMLKGIDVVKGGPKLLKDAYETIKEKVKKGSLKTKEQIVQAYYNAIDFAKNIGSILENSLDVSITKMKEGYKNVKDALEQFKTAISNPKELLAQSGIDWFSGQESFISSIDKFASYIKGLDVMKDDAEEAWDKLSIFKIAHAKGLTAEEFQQKKFELAQQEQQLYIKRSSIEKEYAAIMQSNLDAKAIVKKKESLAKAKLNLDKEFKELANDKEILRLKQNFDRFVSPKYWAEQYYPDLISYINNLKLSSLGKAAQITMNSLGKITQGLAYLANHGGRIGQRLFPNSKEIGEGLTILSRELPALGENFKNLLSVSPIITIEHIKPSQVTVAALKAFTEKKARFLKEHLPKIKNVIDKVKEIQGRVIPLEEKMKALTLWFELFKERVTEQFKSALLKEKRIGKAAKIARDAVISVVTKQKIALNEILEELPFIIRTALEMLPDVNTMFVDFNSTMKNILGKAPINEELIARLMPITGTRIPNIYEGFKRISNGTKNVAE